MRAKPVTLILAAALLLGLGLTPLLVLFASSLTVDGAFGLDRYRDLWASPRLPRLFGRSVLLAGLATLGAIGLGVPLGLLFGKTDLPGRRLFAVGFTLPLLLPPYFLALGWFALLGREGWLARLLSDNPAGQPDCTATPPEGCWAGIAQHDSVARALSEWLFGLPGCAVTLATVFLPLIVLLTAALLHSINPRLEEAARLYVT